MRHRRPIDTITQHRLPALGIDIGRVVIDGSSHPEGGDTAFFGGDEATMLATPEMPGALETIARLVPAFDGRVWLVSKYGPRVQERRLRWLDGTTSTDGVGQSLFVAGTVTRTQPWLAADVGTDATRGARSRRGRSSAA